MILTGSAELLIKLVGSLLLLGCAVGHETCTSGCLEVVRDANTGKVRAAQRNKAEFVRQTRRERQMNSQR